MCCFAGEIEKVENTNLFVSSADGRQIVIYQMSVALAGQPNAMILPVPAAVEDIELLDLTEAAEMFTNLNEAFRTRTRGMGPAAAGGSFLEVHKVGSYDVSIAPDLESLDRVNPDVFTVSKTTKIALKQYERFSFVVAQLTKSGDFHPLGYTHPIPDTGEMFVPTRHVHGGTVTDYLQSLKAGQEPEWDHKIYTQTGTLKAPEGGPFSFKKEESTRGRYALTTVQADLPKSARAYIYPDQEVHRLTCKGRFENTDLTLFRGVILPDSITEVRHERRGS